MKHITQRRGTTQTHHTTMKLYSKARKCFVETIPSPRLGFLSGVFLANH